MNNVKNHIPYVGQKALLKIRVYDDDSSSFYVTEIKVKVILVNKEEKTITFKRIETGTMWTIPFNHSGIMGYFPENKIKKWVKNLFKSKIN
jgi:hypothetical protein